MSEPTVVPPVVDPATPSAPAPQATPPVADWQSGLNPEMKGYVQNKGFKDPESILNSYMNMEKLVGVPKERLLKLPENLEDAASMAEIYAKLGRPAKADDYKFEGMDDSKDPEFSKFAKNAFHELGLTTKQAENLLKKMGQYDKDSETKETEQFQSELKLQEEALKKEWGAAHDNRVQAAKNAFKKFNMDIDLVDKMEKAIGYPAVMKFMYEIGSKLGEATFVGSEGNNGFGGMTPETANARINALIKDQGFQQKMRSKDVAAQKEWEDLHKMANPT